MSLVKSVNLAWVHAVCVPLRRNETKLAPRARERSFPAQVPPLAGYLAKSLTPGLGQWCQKPDLGVFSAQQVRKRGRKLKRGRTPCARTPIPAGVGACCHSRPQLPVERMILNFFAKSESISAYHSAPHVWPEPLRISPLGQQPGRSRFFRQGTTCSCE